MHRHRRGTMRVLFTTKPGYGSFQPLGPLARALIAAGHEVTFAASATFCRVLERAGFRCLPAGFDFSMDDRDRVYDDIRRALGPTSAPFSAVRDVFAGFLAPRMLPDRLAIPEEFSGCVAAEVLGVPHMTYGPFFCFWDGAFHDAPGEAATFDLDRVRTAH